MMAVRDFYSGRRVLVTGHTGFKGSWLSHWLALLGAEVHGFALAPEAGSLFEAARIGERMQSVFGDVRDLGRLQQALEASSAEVVFHLAAQSLVRRSYREPVDTYATNVLGTAHVLEACRRSSAVRAVVVVTSDKCYENRELELGYREDAALGGRDPYSSSKAAAELVTAAFRSSFFASGRVGIASARAGNVIGGGDWAEDRLVPDVVRGAWRDEPIVVRNPKSTRPWQHVLEPLAGYLLLAERLHRDPQGFSEAFNFGPPDAASVDVATLARKLVEQLGSGALELRADVAGEPYEARALKLDSSKARARLGWSPQLSFDEALALTADWYREFHAAPARAADLLDAQIASYTAKLDG
jgi:CDP-glucose 4,6-dehydratase